MKAGLTNLRDICQKLEEYGRDFEISRKNFKGIASEIKPLLYQFPEIERNKINENNRVIDSFLTSISNTSIFALDLPNNQFF